MPLEIAGNIDEQGKLSVFRQGDLKQWINAHRGKEIVLSIKIKGKKRSNDQNAYYWGVVVAMVTRRLNELGNEFDDDETHAFLKGRFNVKEIEPVADHFIEIPLSTSRLGTTEFNDYIAKIQHFGSVFLGIYIPDPNEATELNY